VLAAVIALPATAQGFVLRTTAGGVPVHWPTEPITVYVDPSVTELDPEALTAVERAFSAWESVSGTSAPTVTVAAGAADPIGFRAGAANRCTVRYEASGYAPAGNALAVTVLSYEDDGTIVDADIVFNGQANRQFQVLTGADGGTPRGRATDAASNVFDIEEVVTHEAGHFFGLAHNNADTSVVMYYETDAETIAKRDLTADDENGLRAIYPEDASSPAGCSLANGGDRRGGSWVMLGVAALTAFVSRRRTSRKGQRLG
jgi:hypothetical protein